MTREEKIRKLANKLYLKNKNKGALDNWLEAEKIIMRRSKLVKYIKMFLYLIVASGILNFLVQQKYLKREEALRKKYEIRKIIASLPASYYQETWNQWYAFRDKTPSAEYRRNIQRIVVEAKAVQSELPLLIQR